ncbi:MAG: hypothetical protein M3340_18320, partial [Actinomycetota bacterium]|nr:hypothetical protein [Actinomycetota bacterium]
GHATEAGAAIVGALPGWIAAAPVDGALAALTAAEVEEELERLRAITVQPAIATVAEDTVRRRRRELRGRGGS